MRLRIPKIGFTAWLSLVGLLLAVSLFYAIKQGYANNAFLKPLVIVVVSLGALVRLMRFVKFIKTEGKKDIKEFVRELFKTAREREKELGLAEREWAEESDPRLERLNPAMKSRIQSLEMAYIKDTCARTTLSLAKAYEESGLQDVAQLYYDQLLHDFRWSKEARAFRKASKEDAYRPIT